MANRFGHYGAGNSWGDHDAIFVVTGPEDIIFLTTLPGWRFRTIGEISANTLNMVKKSKRYPDVDFVPNSLQRIQDYQSGRVITLDDDNTLKPTVQQQVRLMDEAGRNVHILADIRPLRKRILVTNMFVGAGIPIFHLLLVLLTRRYQRLTEMKRCCKWSRRF